MPLLILLNNRINKLFETFEKWYEKCLNRITWILLFILNPGHTYQEVEKNRMFTSLEQGEESEQLGENEESIDPAILDIQLSSSHSHYDDEEKRSQIIDEKNKIILTIAALLITALAFVSPNIKIKWLILIPLILITSAIFLVLVHFGVQTVYVPNQKRVMSFADLNKVKRFFVQEFFHCGDKLSECNNYRIGVFRASCRAITLGLLSFMLLCAFMVIDNDSRELKNNNNKIREQLKDSQSNVELSESLIEPQIPTGNEIVKPPSLLENKKLEIEIMNSCSVNSSTTP